jgi:RNA polymerase sigma-70 factor (ECF subfamily)
MDAVLAPEERRLVDRCRAGDEAAWAELFRAHAPQIGLFLRGVLGTSDVDDLVQRVFLELLGSLDRFRGESSLRAWLHGIAHHLALKQIRSAGRQRRAVSAYGELAEGFAPVGSPEDRTAARQQLDCLARAADDLDVRFRAVWVMRELEGMSVEEVAAALGEREATVRTRHHRAREKLLGALAALETSSAKSPPGRRGWFSFWKQGSQA